MARCLRCHAGNEWIEGTPTVHDDSQDDRIAALELELAEARRALVLAERTLGHDLISGKEYNFYRRQVALARAAAQEEK